MKKEITLKIKENRKQKYVTIIEQKIGSKFALYYKGQKFYSVDAELGYTIRDTQAALENYLKK